MVSTRAENPGGSELVFLALGGLGEIGMNCYLYGLGPPDAEELQERARRGPEPLAACVNVIDYVRP